MLSELNQIKDLRLQIISLRESVNSGILDETIAVSAENAAMAKIDALKKQYVDRVHVWNERDKHPRTKSRRGKKVEYYMTHIKIGKETKQLSASTLDDLYERLYDHYADGYAPLVDKNITVRGLYAIFIESKRRDAKEYQTIASRTVSNLESDWNRCFENSKIADLKAISVTQRIVLNEYKRLTGNALITRKAFAKAKGLLDAIFDIAVEANLIDFNPSRTLSTKRLRFKLEEDKSKDVYTSKERDILLKYLKEQDKQTVYTLGVQLAFCFCLRVGELRALTWDDYNEESKTLYIWHQIVDRKKDGKNRVATDVPHTKTNTLDGRRLLHVTPEATRILSELRAINGDKKYILNSSGNYPITTQHFDERLRRFCNRAGVRYLSSHKIRFFGATQLFDAGVDPEQIRRIMGHTTLAMTEHYNRTNGEIQVDEEIWNRIFNN